MMSKKKRNIKNKNNIVKETNYKNNLDFEIFKYLSPDTNTKLSELKGVDLQDLIILLNDFYLSLRKTLDIEKNVTFGLEIEVEHCSRTAVERKISSKSLNSWEVGYDSTVDSGAEIKSPIMIATLFYSKEKQTLENECSPSRFSFRAFQFLCQTFV